MNNYKYIIKKGVNVQPAEAEPRSTKKESPFIDTDEEKELVAPVEPVPQVIDL